MTAKITDSEKHVSHPLEETFDIEENTTVVPYKKVASELVKHKPYDTKDNELDEQFQEVYDAAFEAFEQQAEESEMIDPKYKARNGEIAVQYLNTALQAAREKSQLKQHSDKVIIASNKISNPTTNNVTVDRNELLRALNNHNSADDITDAEFTDVTQPDES